MFLVISFVAVAVGSFLVGAYVTYRWAEGWVQEARAALEAYADADADADAEDGDAAQVGGGSGVDSRSDEPNLNLAASF